MSIEPTNHRPWCDRSACTPDAHRSRKTTINTASGDFEPVSVMIAQGVVRHGQPFVVIEQTDDTMIVCSIRQGRALFHRLRTLVRVAGDDGLTYSREPDDGDDAPAVPPHVEGRSLGRYNHGEDEK